MNPVENKQTIHRYLEAMNSHDVDAAADYFAENAVNHAAVAEAQGRAGVRSIGKKVLAAFPDLSWSCEDMIAEGDRVVCRLSLRGTNTGPLEFLRFPLPASGKKLETEAIHVFRLAGGKIVEHWAGRDDVGMMRQLGHLPVPGAQA